MSRLHLLSSEVNGVVTYYTAYSDGTISSIGTTLDFTKGFSDDILATIGNSVYSAFTNGKVWTNDTDITTEVSESTDGSGLVLTRKETAVNTFGYSGVSSINATVTGSPLFGISFSGNENFMVRGNVNYTSSDKYIPSDATARAKIVTVSSTYANLFDGDNTTSVTTTATGETVVLTFASAVTLKRFVGRLASTSIMPVHVTFQGLDTATSKYVDLGTTSVETSENDFDVPIENAMSTTTYQVKFDFTVGTDSKTAVISEFNVYAQLTKVGWVYSSKDDISTKGMSLATLQALTSTDYAELFNHTQLDIIAYTPSGSSITNFVVSFPANTAPAVTNFTASATATHSDDIYLGFTVKDLEGQATKYKVTVNGVALGDYADTPAGDVVTDFLVTNDKLDVGTNKITITVIDELNAEQSYDYTITKVDNLPSYVGTRIDNTYTFTIKDVDGDKIKYKAVLNGEVIVPTTDFMDVVHTNTITWAKNKVKVGVTNTLVITITDAVGGVTTVTEEWIGVYTGLIFTDANKNFLSSDLGELLQYLDLGTVVAGKPSTPVLINVTNSTSYLVNSISITGPGTLTGDNGKTDTIEFCLTEGFEEGNSTSISIGDMVPNQVVQFYLRITGTDPEAVGDFEFTMTAAGKYTN
jgi:hypothetical protein